MAEFNENLWAPWRMEYIRSLDEERHVDGTCFLCAYAADPQTDAAHHVLWRGESAFVMMNRFPYTNGHLMIAPLRHVGDPADLTPAEIGEMATLVYQGVAVLRKALHAEGFNVGANLGRCAGAGLPDHIHHHVVARWSADTNYMAVLGGIRVIPDGLDATYADLVRVATEMGLRK
ncbi:MAG TPA: HIT domain-containing protein [Phycisphaerae bacterium]|nr:HIT domain-containing protein [Phycisphaerae bacterium]